MTKKISKQELEELARRMTDTDISRQTGIHPRQVNRLRFRWGIPPFQPRRESFDQDAARALAVEGGWPAKELALHFGVSKGTILKKIPEAAPNGHEWRNLVRWATAKHPELWDQIQRTEIEDA